MKNFNINDYIYIQIADKGWEYLKETVGADYIKHCITPCRCEIEGEFWYRLQAHEVFDLLPIKGMGSIPLYNTNIMIDEKSLT